MTARYEGTLLAKTVIDQVGVSDGRKDQKVDKDTRHEVHTLIEARLNGWTTQTLEEIRKLLVKAEQHD